MSYKSKFCLRTNLCFRSFDVFDQNDSHHKCASSFSKLRKQNSIQFFDLDSIFRSNNSNCSNILITNSISSLVFSNCSILFSLFLLLLLFNSSTILCHSNQETSSLSIVEKFNLVKQRLERDISINLKQQNDTAIVNRSVKIYGFRLEGDSRFILSNDE